MLRAGPTFLIATTRNARLVHANPGRRSLGALNLITLGIGAIIGAGIFVLTGTAAANNAGPAVSLSFVLAGITCAFAGLCYAEFASIIPIAGSAYTYGYATLGEFVAWIIGWDLAWSMALARRRWHPAGPAISTVFCSSCTFLSPPNSRPRRERLWFFIKTSGCVCLPCRRRGR